MFKNNNSKVIRNISNKSIKYNKMRNYFVGVIIVIATFLLSFTLIFSYNNAASLQSKTNYQVSFENINDKVIEDIRKNPDISIYGITKYGGKTKSKNINLSFTYADESSMELSNINLEEGNLPKKYNEILLEKEYLTSLNLNKGIGEKIILDYYNGENALKKEEFLITGFIETEAKGTNNRKVFNSIVSKEFVKLDTYSTLVQLVSPKDYSNSEIKDKIKTIGESLKIDEKDVRINYLNVDSNNLNPETKFVVIIVGFLILASCSIVIYNIFYISIFRKVREYGQLRTIGATKKQIKKIIFREGNLLSIKYIPLGVLLGCIASYLISPLAWLIIESLVLSALSGVIILLTVRFSILKPAKIASNISPIEASVYTGGTNKNNIKSIKGKLTPKSLSKIYIKRNKKKTLITFLSLGLSGILFITIASIMSSVNVSDWTKQRYPNGGQYIIKLNDDILSSEYKVSDLQKENPLSNELKEKIVAVSGVEEIVTHKYFLGNLENVDVEENTIDIEGISEKDTDLEKFLVEGKLPSKVYEANEILLNKSAITYQSFGLDYKAGDKIEISVLEKEGKVKKEFVVSGIIDDKNNGNSFMVYNETIDKVMNVNTNYSFEILVNSKASNEIKSSLKSLAEYEEKITFLSLEDEININKKMFSNVIAVIYIFTLLIVCFGIVNLINTIVTNILTRKNELSIMEALGLTKGQLIKMINIENFYIVFGSMILSIGFGGVLGYKLCKVIENTGGLSYVQYKFPLLLISLYILVAFLILFFISRFVGKTIRNKSLVERLKDI